MTDRRMTDFHALGAAARPLNDDEWGSERQIAAENAFTDAALTVLTQGQLDDIWHKATTEEGIAGTLAAITRRTVTLAQPTPPDASPLYLGARSVAEKAAEIVQAFNSGCSPSHYDSLLKDMGEIIAEERGALAEKPILCVVLEGGMISDIVSNRPELLAGVKVVSVDYDVEGSDATGFVRQTSGGWTEAILGQWSVDRAAIGLDDMRGEHFFECDECGEPTEGGVSALHAETCSMHPNNVVEPAATVAREG